MGEQKHLGINRRGRAVTENSPPPLDLSRNPPPAEPNSLDGLLDHTLWETPRIASVLIPFDDLPDAVRHYLWAHAPHMLDYPCRYTMLRDGALLIEAL
jgi:hypothetical protein